MATTNEPLFINLAPTATGFIDTLLMLIESSELPSDRMAARLTLKKIAQMATGEHPQRLDAECGELIEETKFLKGWKG